MELKNEGDTNKNDLFTTMSPYRQYLFDHTFEHENLKSYLEHFSSTTLDEIYKSVFQLLELTCADYKGQLDEVCELVQNHLLNIDIDIQNEFSPAHQMSILDFYSRVPSCFTAEHLDRVFPRFSRNFQILADQFGDQICSLMALPHITEPRVERLFAQIVKLNQDRIDNLGLILRAMLIVFIKCDSSFVIIHKYIDFYTPKLFQAFLSHLDSFLLDERKLTNFYVSLRLEYCKRRNQKMIKRFLYRIHCNVNTNLIPKNSTPRFIETSNWETLLYLTKSCYRHKSLSRDAFFELAKKLVEDSPEIKHRFLSCLRKQNTNEENEFKSYCQNFQRNSRLPASQMFSLSSLIKLADEESAKNIPATYGRRRPPPEHYTGKPWSDIPVYFVYEEVALRDIIHNQLPKFQMIAIDAEWLPIFSYRKHKISIIQIATTDSCYVIDLDNFSQKSEAYKSLWFEFVSKYFQNPNYLKIGYGIGQDIDILQYSTGQSSPIQLLNNIDLSSPTRSVVQFLSNLNIRSYPKLQVIIRRAERVSNSSSNDNYDDGAGQLQGLSLLTYVLFGKRLDKTNRQSDWTRRPLRHAQLLYSALDAYCLIDIYEKLDFIQEELQSHFEAFNDVRSFLDYLRTLGLNY